MYRDSVTVRCVPRIRNVDKWSLHTSDRIPRVDLAAYLSEAKPPVRGAAAELHRLSLTVPTTELRAETCIRFEQMAALVWEAAVDTEAGTNNCSIFRFYFHKQLCVGVLNAVLTCPPCWGCLLCRPCLLGSRVGSDWSSHSSFLRSCLGLPSSCPRPCLPACHPARLGCCSSTQQSQCCPSISSRKVWLWWYVSGVCQDIRLKAGPLDHLWWTALCRWLATIASPILGLVLRQVCRAILGYTLEEWIKGLSVHPLPENGKTAGAVREQVWGWIGRVVSERMFVSLPLAMCFLLFFELFWLSYFRG